MLTELEKRIVVELQEDLPLCPHPFRLIAERIGIKEEELLAKIREMKARKLIRRLGAVLRHRKAGYVANAMVVWRVPEKKVKEVGKMMASFSEVSHCYQRVSRPDWTYNLFTMIHGKSRDECEQIATLLSEKVKIKDYRLLYSLRELKKTSMKYFRKDELAHVCGELIREGVKWVSFCPQ